MSTRNITVILACVATLAVTNSAMAQDTTRTRDSLQRQMQTQQPARMLTAQARDSLITQLLDSANRTTNATIAQQLRDSVTTLRALTVSGNPMNMRMQSDTMMNRQNTTTSQQSAQQRNAQQQTTQQQNTQQQNQQRQATSDQRLRVQKDRPDYNYQTGASPDSSATRRP